MRLSVEPGNSTVTVEALLSRYVSVMESRGADAADLLDAFNSLRLANALLAKAGLSGDYPNHPPQITIMGPTQAGKSTLVNLLLDATNAGVSPLAGFTVHAQGFAINCAESSLAPLEQFMAPLRRVTHVDLDKHNSDCYLLESASAGPAALVDSGVVWDSPDFDSIESLGYRGAVLQAAAVADVLILMVSKDKYADKSVWDMLALMRNLGKPVLVCINKLDAQDADTVTKSFQQRHLEQFATAAPPIVFLPFIRKIHDGQTATNATFSQALPASSLRNLRDAVQQSVRHIDRAKQQHAANEFVSEHWDVWMEPVRHELAAAQDWRQAVSKTVEQAETNYVDRYLNNPRKYDTFNRAIAELLTLLEIPGLATTLLKTRELVTWPARKLLGIGRRSLSRNFTNQPDEELDVLDRVWEQSLTHLQSHILAQLHEQQQQHSWWLAIHQELNNSQAEIAAEFSAAAIAYQQAFEPRIESAARQLFASLQQQPVLLNSLRAARITTDAAAVALAVKSGGLAAADLLLAPAMLSVTTLLTESALGRYMETIKSELKAEQLELVCTSLLNDVLQVRMLSLESQLAKKPDLLIDDRLKQIIDAENITAEEFAASPNKE